jgi:hypothetical protein
VPDEDRVTVKPSSTQRFTLEGDLFDRIASMRLDRAGGVSIAFVDGRCATSSLGRDVFDSTSLIASSTYVPHRSQLHLRTTRDDEILIELPLPTHLAPTRGRPTIYLDQNHWSTLTKVIYEPHRVRNAEEGNAAERVIESALGRQVLLPMSSAHMSETCKQVDVDERYQRALTIVRLSLGWQLRDPLALRRFELRQALTTRYHQRSLSWPAPVTLEPNAIHSGRDDELAPVDSILPVEARWTVHAIRCIGGIVDAMLDTEHLAVEPASGWAAEFQRFAEFLRDNPTGREMKRRRTHAKFLADLGRELPEAAYRAGITLEEMSDWLFRHSEFDVTAMPALGLFREVLHEKLADPKLRWAENDLVDMIYLTAAAGYCDYVVGENSHTAHLENALRRLGREPIVHRNLRSLVGNLAI